MTTPNFTWTCIHCGQRCGDRRAATGRSLTRRAYPRIVQPVRTGRPDCYARVTEYGEPVGALIGVEPMPAGVEDIRKAGSAV